GGAALPGRRVLHARGGGGGGGADVRARHPRVRLAARPRVRSGGVPAQGAALRAVRGGGPRPARVPLAVGARPRGLVDRHRGGAGLEAPRAGRAAAARRLPRGGREPPRGRAQRRRRHRAAHEGRAGPHVGAVARGGRGAHLLLHAFVVLGPLASLAVWSLAERWTAPSPWPQRFGLKYWNRMLTADFLEPLRLGVVIALVVTALALVLAIPLGYALARLSFPGRALV